jgi:AcrR family transcriptional regulator
MEIQMGRPPRISNDRLLQIARMVFVRDGASGSTKAIAALAGISEAAIFQRYKTKAALFLAAMSPVHADTVAIVALAEGAADGRDALHILGGAVLAYFREALPVMLPVIAHPAIGLEELLKHMGDGPAMEITQALQTYLEEQAIAGAAHVPYPRAAAAMLVTSMHSVALFELMGLHGGVMPEAGLNSMIDSLWFGLEPKTARALQEHPHVDALSRD